jgi:hypothetical protein
MHNTQSNTPSFQLDALDALIASRQAERRGGDR